MPYNEIKGELILNELTEEQLHSQESLPPNQYWLTPDDTEKLKEFNLPLGMILPSAIIQEHPALHLLDGSVLSQSGIYKNFVTFLKQQIAEGKIVAYTNTQYDGELNTYGQCGHFVIDDTNNTFRLPTITEFIASSNGGKTIGLAELDSFKSHTHSVNNQQETLILAPNGSYSGLLTSITGFETGATGGEETKPKNIRYPYYIVLANNLEVDASSLDIDGIVNDIGSLSQSVSALSQTKANIYPVVSKYQNTRVTSTKTFNLATDYINEDYVEGAVYEVYIQGYLYGTNSHKTAWGTDILPNTTTMFNISGNGRQNGFVGSIAASKSITVTLTSTISGDEYCQVMFTGYRRLY